MTFDELKEGDKVIWYGKEGNKLQEGVVLRKEINTVIFTDVNINGSEAANQTQREDSMNRWFSKEVGGDSVSARLENKLASKLQKHYKI